MNSPQKPLLITRTLMASAVAFALIAPAAHAGAIHDANLFTTNFPGNDDGSTALQSLGFGINFNGVNYSSAYVNNNGNITFTAPLSTFTPFGITGGSLPMLAPFFADVDTRSGNTVHYGTSTLGGHNVFGVNWIGVGYLNPICSTTATENSGLGRCSVSARISARVRPSMRRMSR